MSKLVIVVDMQKDFVLADGALPVPEAETLVTPMQEWLGMLKPEETAGVLMTFDTHVPDVYNNSPESEQFPIHCVRGTEGWKTVLPLGTIKPEITVWRLEKGVFGMWEEPHLNVTNIRNMAAPAMPRDEFFEDLKQKGVTEVDVVGVAADFCVKWAIDGLVERGFKVNVPQHLTKGIERQISQVVTEDFGKSPVKLVTGTAGCANRAHGAHAVATNRL